MGLLTVKVRLMGREGHLEFKRQVAPLAIRSVSRLKVQMPGYKPNPVETPSASPMKQVRERTSLSHHSAEKCDE